MTNKDTEDKIDLNSKNVRIGMLRQWLNEERIKDAKYFVTNEDLELWLDPAFSQLENEARIDEAVYAQHATAHMSRKDAHQFITDRIATLNKENEQ